MKPTLSKQLINEIVEHWAQLTVDEPEERPHLPIKVLLGEAVDLAEVVDQHFETTTSNGKTRLGLDSVGGRGGVNAQVATEMRELQLAASNAHSRYVVLVAQASNASIERADEILTELRAVLGFVLSDGSNPTGEEQLSRLREEHDQSGSHDGIAMALEGYSELASQYSKDLESLNGFDHSLIPEALQVAQALRQRSADRLTGQLAQDQRDMMRLRNRLLAALTQRMSAVRRAMRFVFRDSPETARKAGSEYLRSRKQRSRSPSDLSSSEITDTEASLEAAAPGH